LISYIFLLHIEYQAIVISQKIKVDVRSLVHTALNEAYNTLMYIYSNTKV